MTPGPNELKLIEGAHLVDLDLLDDVIPRPGVTQAEAREAVAGFALTVRRTTMRPHSQPNSEPRSVEVVSTENSALAYLARGLAASISEEEAKSPEWAAARKRAAEVKPAAFRSCQVRDFLVVVVADSMLAPDLWPASDAWRRASRQQFLDAGEEVRADCLRDLLDECFELDQIQAVKAFDCLWRFSLNGQPFGVLVRALDFLDRSGGIGPRVSRARLLSSATHKAEGGRFSGGRSSWELCDKAEQQSTKLT